MSGKNSALYIGSLNNRGKGWLPPSKRISKPIIYALFMNDFLR